MQLKGGALGTWVNSFYPHFPKIAGRSWTILSQCCSIAVGIPRTSLAEKVSPRRPSRVRNTADDAAKAVNRRPRTGSSQRRADCSRKPFPLFPRRGKVLRMMLRSLKDSEIKSSRQFSTKHHTRPPTPADAPILSELVAQLGYPAPAEVIPARLDNLAKASDASCSSPKMAPEMLSL